MSTITERHVRKIAAGQGLSLIKYRAASRWYPDYGPYALADDRRNLVACGMELDDVAASLT